MAADRPDGTAALRIPLCLLNVDTVNWTSSDVAVMSRDGEYLTTYLDCGRYHWRDERTCTREEYGSTWLTSVKGRSLDNVVVEGPPGRSKNEPPHGWDRRGAGHEEPCECSVVHSIYHNEIRTKKLSDRTSFA